MNRQELLDFCDVEVQKISVPEWQRDVYIRTLSGHAREEVESYVTKGTKVRAVLVVHGMCDENGNLIFNKNDVDAVNQKSAAALERIGMAILKLNKMTNEETAVLEKN